MLLALGNESGGFKLGKKDNEFSCSNLISCTLSPDWFLKLGLEDYILFGVEHNHWGS